MDDNKKPKRPESTDLKISRSDWMEWNAVVVVVVVVVVIVVLAIKLHVA
jgi:hypothetical protein